jgi:hypothetical protein
MVARCILCYAISRVGPELARRALEGGRRGTQMRRRRRVRVTVVDARKAATFPAAPMAISAGLLAAGYFQPASFR